VGTVLVCVRSSVAAQAIAVYADRVGVASALRTAVSAVEVMARLAERAADTILVDTALTRPDPVGFVRRALTYAPGATLVLFGPEDSQVAAAAVAAGARGVIRSGDQDLVTAVTKTLLLLCLPGRTRAEGGTTAQAAPGTGGPGTGPEDGGWPESAPVVAPPAAGAETAASREAREARESLVPSQREEEGTRPRRPALTERELQVLRGMADGKSNAEIGRDLFVSEDTVKTHARRLFRKLNARDRAHAVAAGFRTGLVS
jgi:DNA-binding NarL/FixJ family response regulator